MDSYSQCARVLVAALLLAAPAAARMGPDEGAAGGAAGSQAGYDADEGGFYVRSADGDYKLVVGGRLQAMFDGIRWDDALGRDDTATFQVRRARLYLVGNLMGRETTYYVQLGADSPDAGLAYPATGTSDFRLFDGWIKHEVSPRFAIKAGQFKVPFSRQDLTSAGKLQLPVRSLATDLLFFDRRDVGVEVSGGLDRLLYAVALVNGDGPNRLNADDRVALYGRLSFNPTGDYGWSEGDVEGTAGLASTIGIAAHYQAGAPELDGADVTRINLDGGIKKNGASLQAELALERVDPGPGDDRTFRSFYVQGGWFVRPGRVELVARASRVASEGDDNDASEYIAGANLYSMGHRLKWQAAYGYYDQEAGNLVHHRLLALAQLWF